MLNIDQFKSVASIEKAQPDTISLNELPPPHLYARDILSKFSGIRLIPFEVDSNEKFDVRFGIQWAVGCQQSIRKLGIILRLDLYPIASAAYDSGILIVSPQDEVYSLSIDSDDVYFLGNLEKAIWTMLKGEEMKPVLPRRPYPQGHGYSVYSPSSDEVKWIDTSEWIVETKAN